MAICCEDNWEEESGEDLVEEALLLLEALQFLLLVDYALSPAKVVEDLACEGDEPKEESGGAGSRCICSCFAHLAFCTRS